MTKTFLLTTLAGFAGVASAQTPPRPLTPTSTPPAPVQQVAFKVMPQPAPAAPPAEKMLTKVFDIAALISPPAESPLAQPTDDVAMKAAVKAYTAAKVKQLMTDLRRTVKPASWDGNGGAGRLDFYAHGSALVVNATADVQSEVGERIEAMRHLNAPHVFVQMTLFSAKSEHPAVRKLLDKTRATPLTPDEVKATLLELKKDGAVDILSRPQLMLRDRQTGFFQVGQQYPRLTGTSQSGTGKTQQGVEYINTGIVVRMTPDVSADRKFVRLRAELSMTEPSTSRIDLGNGQFATPIDCQAVESELVVPDGGTMAVNFGTKKSKQRIETKVPFLGDLPYVGRLFRSVGISHDRRDTIAVVTVTRVTDTERLVKRQSVAWAVAPVLYPNPLPTPAKYPAFELQGVNGSTLPANAVPVAPPAPSAKPKGSFSLQLGWSAKSGPTARVSVKPAPTAPVVAPPAVAPGVRLERCEQPTVAAPPIAVPPPAPASLLPATPAPVVPPPAVYLYTQVTPIPMPIHHPFASQSPVTPQVLRLVGRDGLERIGVDIDCPVVPASGSVPVTGRVSGGGGAAVGGVIGHLGEAPSTLMTAYHAACAAGKKDEAARLALQLLANDPTCFSRNK